jgi:hypothetical protein
MFLEGNERNTTYVRIFKNRFPGHKSSKHAHDGVPPRACHTSGESCCKPNFALHETQTIQMNSPTYDRMTSANSNRMPRETQFRSPTSAQNRATIAPKSGIPGAVQKSAVKAVDRCSCEFAVELSIQQRQGDGGRRRVRSMRKAAVCRFAPLHF